MPVGTVYTDSYMERAAAFILSEANGHRSRAAITIASGAGVLVPGTVVQSNGSGKYVAFTATEGSGSELETEAAGIIIYGIDATSEDVEVAAIVRDAEVNLKAMAYPEESTAGGEKANTIASLGLLGIIARD